MALIDIVTKDSTNRSVELTILNSDGSKNEGVAWDDAALITWYRREGGAVVPMAEVSLAATTTAHTDRGFIHLDDGVYRLDLPDAAFATGANKVTVGGANGTGEVIGGTVRLTDFDLEAAAIASADLVADIITGLAPEVRYNTAQAGAATTITLDTGANATDDYYNGTLILILGGTGSSTPPQTRVIIDYDGTTKVATVAAWTVEPDATSVFLVLGLN